MIPRILGQKRPSGSETDWTGPAVLGAIIVPVIVALFLGLGIAVVADSIVLKLLGLAAAAMPFLLVRISILKRTLLTLALFEIVFPIDVYIGAELDPDELGAIATLNPDHVNAVAGLNVSVTAFCLFVLYGLWMAEKLAGQTPDVGRYKKMLPAFAYVLALIGSLAVAQSPTLALYEITLAMQALLLMVYVIHFTSTRADVWFIAFVLILGLTTQLLLVLAQSGIGFSFDLGPIKSSRRGARAAGTFGSPNALGSYLSLMAAPAFGLAISRSKSYVRHLATVAFVLIPVGLFFSFSRGAWAGFAVSMLIMAAFAYQRAWMSRKILLAGVTLFGVVIVGAFGNPIAERIATGSTLENRLDLIEIAWSMIRDRPLFGVGSNNFAASIGPYITQEFSATWISTVHSKYMLVWAETGLVGLIPFLWLLISSLNRAWRTSLVADRTLSPFVLGLGAGIVANMTHMAAEIYHGRQQTQMLWLVLALIIAISNLVAKVRGQGLLSAQRELWSSTAGSGDSFTAHGGAS